jgi:PKD repeat protein
MWYSRLKIKVSALAAITTLLLSPTFSHAQSNLPFNCGSDQYFEQKMKENPELRQQRQEMVENLVELRNQGLKSGRSSKKIIPVVFHIIHTYGAENISKQKVLDQIRSLNEQYSAMNPDLSSVRDMYKGLVGTADVEFRLATKDPQGNCTDGIVRTYSMLTVNARDNVKGLSYWDANKYLNIWVVASITNFGSEGTVLGYAQFPWDNNKYTDGIVVRADQVAYGNKTLAHEIGHYLGLLHTFETYAGSGCGNNCQSTGDMICDTPPSTGPTNGCPGSTYNTCTLDQPDQPDMWENYMDYSTCQHMFTIGQVDQMNAILAQFKRGQMIAESNLIATGTDDNAVPGNCTPVADFYAPLTVVCEGGTLNFKDNTFNGTPDTYLWTFEGGTPTSSPTKDPAIKFNKAGVYKVGLKVSNASGETQVEKTAFVEVMPAISDSKTPVAENFEAYNPAGYEFSQDSKGLKWALSTQAATSGTHSMWLDNSAGTLEQVYNLTLPMVDMSTAPDLKLRFRMAYAQKSSTTNDELRVQVSTNCEQNFNSIYYKFGSSLATTTKYYTSAFLPAASEWRDVEISLGSYASYRNLLIRFNLKNRGGNDIFIDDISIGGVPTGIEENNAQGAGISLYPNPSNDIVNLSVRGVPAMPGEIEIYDVAGRKLQHINDVRIGDGAGVLQLGRSEMNLPGTGVYLIKITLGSQAFVQKLVITE